MGQFQHPKRENNMKAPKTDRNLRKGGIGKSTATSNISAALSVAGYRESHRNARLSD
jgi:hypothetical protein